MRIRSYLYGTAITLLLLVLIVLSTPASSQEATSNSDPFDISAQKCAENSNLGCVTMTDDGDVTIGNFISEFIINTGLKITLERVIQING